MSWSLGQLGTRFAGWLANLLHSSNFKASVPMVDRTSVNSDPNGGVATSSVDDGSYYSGFDFQNILNTLTGVNELDEFNAAQAQAQRDWTEQMMNTQYQRTVADMKAAGINPAGLSAGAQLNSMSSGYSASSVGSQAGSSLNAIASIISAAINATGKVVSSAIKPFGK